MLKPEVVSNWTVLIVDDEPDNLNIPREILSFYGAKVHTAANGEAGLEIIRNTPITFILLDLSMPVMDGWEMLKIIRQDPKFTKLPVIALTAHAMRGDKEKVLEAGFTGYISKPFFIPAFLEEIERCMAATT